MSCDITKRDTLECLDITPDPVITRDSFEEMHAAVYTQNQTEKVHKIIVDYTQSRIDMRLTSCIDMMLRIQSSVDCPQFFIACICSEDTKNYRHAYVLKLLFDVARLHDRSPVVFHLFKNRTSAQEWIKNPSLKV